MALSSSLDDALAEAKDTLAAEANTLDNLYIMLKAQTTLVSQLQARVDKLTNATNIVDGMPDDTTGLYDQYEDTTSKLQFSLASQGAALLFATVDSSSLQAGIARLSETSVTPKTS